MHELKTINSEITLKMYIAKSFLKVVPGKCHIISPFLITTVCLVAGPPNPP